MKELTEKQQQALNIYNENGRSLKKASNILGVRKNSLMETLFYCATKGCYLTDPTEYENPYQFDFMQPDRATTHVRYDKEGHEVKQIWYKDKANNNNIEVILKALQERVPCSSLKIKKRSKYDQDTLLEIIIADSHIGMLAWKDETGDDNYNLKNARKLYLSAIQETLERCGYVGKIRIVLLGDIMHTDGLDALTPESHHVLDVDSRFDKILTFATDIIFSCIELCADHCQEIEVFTIRGNHDKNAAIGLRHILNEHFRMIDNIKIDMSPAKSRFTTFGCSAFCYSHGDKVKLDRLAGDLLIWIAQNDIKGTRDFYVKRGHLHHFEENDINGVTCQTMPTLIPKDAFAASGSWLSKRALISNVYDKNKGLMTTYCVTPRQLNL